MSLPITSGNDLALAVSQNCANKIAAIVYHAGVLPTAAEGDLTPVSCLTSIPLIGPLLARFIKPGDYGFRLDLKQPVFDFLGNNQIRITGGAEVSLTLNGAPQASLEFDLALLITISLVSPGSQPVQPDEPQIKVDIGLPDVTIHGEGLPPGLQWALAKLSDAAAAFFVDHVLNLPAFPAFFREQGYGVILGGVEVSQDQLIVRTDLEWPGRGPVPPILRRLVMTRVPFSLRHPHRASLLPGVGASSAGPLLTSYRPLPPIVRPGEITWPRSGPDYDFALALNKKPVQDVLEEKFPIDFPKTLPDPINRVDFTIQASFQMMDAATDKVELAASIQGENSSSAVVHCTGEAGFRIEVDLVRQPGAVKGKVAALDIDVKKAKCKTAVGEVSAAKLIDWLADQANLKGAVDDKLRERFGEPLIPLTFTIFQQAIAPDLSVSIDLSNVDIVQNELQVWITVHEATAPHWRWPR